MKVSSDQSPLAALLKQCSHAFGFVSSQQNDETVCEQGAMLPAKGLAHLQRPILPGVRRELAAKYGGFSTYEPRNSAHALIVVWSQHLESIRKTSCAILNRMLSRLFRITYNNSCAKRPVLLRSTGRLYVHHFVRLMLKCRTTRRAEQPNRRRLRCHRHRCHR